MLPARILAIDDEVIFAELLQRSLESVGYTVVVGHSGKEALQIFATTPIDLVLVDVLMPDMDGFTLCRELRTRSRVPIVLVTAMDNADDILYGFSLGADDYITKPFQFREIAARIQTILQRSAWLADTAQVQPITYPNVILDPLTHSLHLGKRKFQLTPIETRLLHHFLRQPNTVIAHRDLCQAVWGYSFIDDVVLLEVTVRQVCEKLDLAAMDPLAIETIPGIGYQCLLTLP